MNQNKDEFPLYRCLKMAPYKFWSDSNKKCIILTMEKCSPKNLLTLHSIARKGTKFEKYKIISICVIHRNFFYCRIQFWKCKTNLQKLNIKSKSQSQLNNNIILPSHNSFFAMGVICFFLQRRHLYSHCIY